MLTNSCPRAPECGLGPRGAVFLNTVLEQYLGHQTLVLAQPGFPHSCLAVKSAGELFQFLLSYELVPQGQFSLMFRFFQSFPGLQK